MSHFTDVKVELKNKQSIVLALKAMGFKSNMIETATSNTLGLKEYNGPFSGKKHVLGLKEMVGEKKKIILADFPQTLVLNNYLMEL